MLHGALAVTRGVLQRLRACGCTQEHGGQDVMVAEQRRNTVVDEDAPTTTSGSL